MDEMSEQLSRNAKLQRQAENCRRYRARKKATHATSAACDLAQPSTSTATENTVVAVNDVTKAHAKRQRQAEYNRQYRARKKALGTNNDDKQQRQATTSKNNDNTTCDLAQPSTSTEIEHPVVAVSDVGTLNPLYISENEEMRGNTLHEILGCANKRDDTKLRLRWALATDKFHKLFTTNEFGTACSICDRLWFASDVKRVLQKHVPTLLRYFPGQDVQSWVVCSNCYRYLNLGKLAPMCKWFGFQYPPKPTHLPPLNDISARLISPRLPFMQLRRLQHDTGAKAIVGQIVNMQVDVDDMVRRLPRNLDDDCAINVHIKRKIIHKSSYLQGFVKKRVLRLWLEYLVKQPLYKKYNITFDTDRLTSVSSAEGEGDDDNIETLHTESACDSDIVAARQRTLMWNEDMCLQIAPGQHKVPLSIIYDEHAEELSFPQIYYGVGREFRSPLPPTPFMIATSEIRRRDRRGVTPDHVLYMGMKILRLRVAQGIQHTFKCNIENENITRANIQDREFIQERVDKNLSFLKSVPNSCQYWADRKRDLFAMIRQLGKPTAFLTISANEIRWPKLISILHRLNDYYKDVDVENLTRSMRSTLVNEDPVTCCIYFNRMVDIIMQILKSKSNHNPFGNYRVVDYFLRIEFQHRGSPHAHIILWLDDDPEEDVNEEMPKTIRMATDLCSVDRKDLDGDEQYERQVHKHTFTCTKRGEKKCRFNIPYWPMPITTVLCPLPKKRSDLKKRADELREILEVKRYEAFESFLIDNKLNLDEYLNIIRASIRRPTIIFRRDMTQLWTNTFNPWVASVLKSNTDLQIILDEYSCAAYVVEYVNKSNRGISHLHRELIEMQKDNPELAEDDLIKRLALKMLNSVEMSSQEAAWYLLRQKMSHASRQIFYVPTVWPHERQKAYKKKAQMDKEGIELNSTDVWIKGPIQRYEERPAELEGLCLADFLSWYTPVNLKRKHVTEDDDSDVECEDAAETNINTKYRKRVIQRVLRMRSYDLSDVVNYKREMVLLYIPFRSEVLDVNDRNRFMETFDKYEIYILAKRKEYEKSASFQQLIQELHDLKNHEEDDERTMEEDDELKRGNVVPTESDADILSIPSFGGLSVVRRREGILPKQKFCELMRQTNKEQRALLLEFIHRIHTPDSEPIQIFFHGPAGSGKTFTLKLLMEICNRYTTERNTIRNAYVACASTGKAASALDGTTVHSAFRIAAMRTCNKPMARETEQNYRGLFNGVIGVIVDEISMLGCDIFHKIDSRLKQITAVHDVNFGGLHIVMCGDLRQLPPVNATPIYKCSRNMLGGPVLWQSLYSYPLQQVMRQSNNTFSSILTKIGGGIPLNVEENALIESRFTTKEWCDEHVRDAVRLYHDNRSVDEYNAKAIRDPEHESIARDSFTGYSTDVELAMARKELHRLKITECLGFPYSIRLAKGYPYMITSNIDVDDGLVNGAIGTLQYIEHLEDREVTEDTDTDKITQTVRLWLKFESKRVGAKARLKAKPYVTCKGDLLKGDWTPIRQQSVRIGLGRGKVIKCRRIQFPITSACAITIHKSQGGTFDQIVYQYDKRQDQRLVYVGMSRVTSIDGLYMTNATDDFIFYHGTESEAPGVKEVREEYLRLERHQLPTLYQKADRFMPYRKDRREKEHATTFAISYNVQSLHAHKEDVETDDVLTRSDYLVLNETWMDKDSLVTLNNYDLIHHKKREPGRTAGGVAIYRHIDCLTDAVAIPDDPRVEKLVEVKSGIGDVCLVSVCRGDRPVCVLGSVYVHPNVKFSEVKSLFFSALARYGTWILRLIPDLDVDLEVPVVLLGDFNVEIKDHSEYAEFMEKQFGLKHHPIESPTTLGCTRIDHAFLRNINTECMPYVSYFSYHRPILHQITEKAAICYK